MSRFIAICLLALLSSVQDATKDDVKPYEDGESYNVYSAVLALQKEKGNLLIADTTTHFNSCLDSDSDRLARQAIDDYQKVNQTKWSLGHHFAINRPYRLLSQEEISKLLEPDKKSDNWPLSPYHGIHRFSAVGFNADKTIAFVEMDVICGGLCGHGSPYTLQKKNGKWVHYSPPPVENSDGTMTFSGTCGWFY
jgi:hypothetical protein